MQTPGPGAADEAPVLDEQAVSYLKLLKTLRNAGQYSGAGAAGGDESEASATDLGVVERIAAWITSGPVLHYICLTPRWYDDWGIKEALVRNDHTPEAFRVEIEKQISIFDLMRELDAPELSDEERTEIREDVRSLFTGLSNHDRRVVKQRAYSLSSSRRSTAPETGEVDPQDLAAAEVVEAKLAQLEALVDAPVAEAPEPDLSDTQAIEEEALFQAEDLVEAEPTTAEPLAEAPLTEDATAEAPVAEAPIAETPVVEALVEAEPLDADSEEALVEVEAEVEAAVEAEPLLEPAAEAPVEPPAKPGLDLDDIQPEKIPNLPLEQKVALAKTAERAEVLGVLAHEFNDEVQLALVGNPALTEDVAGILARRATTRVAIELYRNKTLFNKPRVRQGLINCPNAPPSAQLEIVGSIGSLSGLIKVLGSPKIKALEVKSKARSRLTERFRSMSLQEKVAAVRQGGRLLLKELWGDFFRNEELVLKCLQEKQLDEGTVLEIARNKIAPRRALEAIGNNPAWTANYQIVLALVFNPKTPRGVVTKLVRKLNPADRRRVKNNPSLPQFVRRLA